MWMVLAFALPFLHRAVRITAPVAITHDPEGGFWGNTEDIVAAMAENPLLDGITLSGGEPFLQPVACLALAKEAHRLGLNVWTYTGYTWEELFAENNAERLALLWETDVLIAPAQAAKSVHKEKFETHFAAK